VTSTRINDASKQEQKLNKKTAKEEEEEEEVEGEADTDVGGYLYLWTIIKTMRYITYHISQ